MQQNTIIFFATVSNAPRKRVFRNGRHYIAFGVSVRDPRTNNLLNYNVVAFGRPAQFASQLHKNASIKLGCSAFNQPDNSATIPLLTATFVCPLRRAER
jgi:hypothetical protein